MMSYNPAACMNMCTERVLYNYNMTLITIVLTCTIVPANNVYALSVQHHYSLV